MYSSSRWLILGRAAAVVVLVVGVGVVLYPGMELVVGVAEEVGAELDLRRFACAFEEVGCCWSHGCCETPSSSSRWLILGRVAAAAVVLVLGVGEGVWVYAEFEH